MDPQVYTYVPGVIINLLFSSLIKLELEVRVVFISSLIDIVNALKVLLRVLPWLSFNPDISISDELEIVLFIKLSKVFTLYEG